MANANTGCATTVATVTAAVAAAVRYPAAARTKTSSVSVQLFTNKYKMFAALLMLTPKHICILICLSES